MNGRYTLLYATGCALLAASAFGQQDRAVPRSGGGGSSSAGSHPSPSVHSSGRSSGSSSSSTSSHATPSHSMTTAQRRHPRAGTGRGGGGGGYYPSHPVYPGYPGWGWGGYYPAYWGYWWPYGYGYSGWGGGGYWASPWGAGAVYSYAQPDRGAIRVLVDPSDARVYVDGYYAGVVDDFDGLFQRLHLAPGRHEISLKLGGHKTHRVRVYAGSGSTLKIDHQMEEGTGETFEDLAPDSALREVRRTPTPPVETYGPREQEAPAGAAGELQLLVNPRDASVYVDGEFRGTGREAGTLALPPGRHRVEVVRPGYRTAEREVDVTPNGSAELSIELQRP